MKKELLDLKPKYLHIVRQILKKHAPLQVVWAYGSRVTGGAHEGSDLDLVVLNPENQVMPKTCILKLQAAFEESPLPIKVDVLDWALLPDSFRQSIQRGYMVIWEPFKE